MEFEKLPVKMLGEIYDYLKEPALVAKVQNYFGVELLEENKETFHPNGSPAFEQNKQGYRIKNKFWYYLFLFGTALGDELFYSCFIPFWFWNVDGAVGRRIILVWTLVMYVGQSIKDILCWPRPGYPVVRLQSKWALEYGMPSTHAMVGMSIPFSVLLYTMNRYEYNVPLGLTIAIAWCSLICVSRIYLGMHTVLDIIAGLLLTILLMFPLVPLIDKLDNYFLTSQVGPFLLLAGSIMMIVYYPISVKWTPTRGDTAMILSVCVGVHIGSWLNYQTGIMSHSDLPQPYTIFWPSLPMLGCTILRTVIGFFFVLLTRIIGKYVSYNFLCALLRVNPKEIKKSENAIHNKHKNFVELGCKYFTCGAIGFNALYLLPHLFRYLHIERPTFYTEI